MHKLARIAKIIVDLCEKYNLSEEDLPTSLRSILDSLKGLSFQSLSCSLTLTI